MSEKSEVLFYELANRTVEQTLPHLLEKTLSRGWRAVVQVGTPERLESIDQALWTFDEESFLPHGTPKDGFETEQPIYLTEGQETPNGASVRFLVDGAEPADFVSHNRLVYLYDGKDAVSKTYAKQQKDLAEQAGCNISSWRQSEEGRWEKS
ncbi:MAG: DNA polymerase III subunit chi [Hyphomicrobium sp.]